MNCNTTHYRANSSSVPGDPTSKIAAPYPYYDPGCAITVHKDGRYEGDVTPGYAILNVYAWQDCSTTRDADGSGSTSCGPEYLSWSKTLTLAGDDTTHLDIALPSRASPDATVSGYLVDIETGEAIPGATISFSNQETYAYGNAQTDSDGSYKLRLRSGYHTVSVWMQGYLSWEGVVNVPKGASSFDVQLTPGQEAGGGCCYAYAMDKAEGAPAPMAAGGSSGVMSSSAPMAAGGNGGGSSGAAYEDLGGGLGPYHASERSGALAQDGSLAPAKDKGAPAGGLLLVGAALGAALVLRRRLA